MALPAFAVDFLRAGWNAHESALCMGRKNAKSAVCAVLALGHLVGPLRTPGWRGAIASVSKEKAGELRGQVAAIAEASGLDLRIRRAPYPGRIESTSGTLEVLSADRTAGHASGFDLVIVDETGLMPERARELLAGLRSSVSAKAGRVVHISVRGDSPLFREILDNPATTAHVHAAPDACAIDDRTAWHAANPGIAAGIKQLGYMAHEVNRIRGAPADEPSFRAFDLNQALSPRREMILSPDDLRACFTDDPPPRWSGPCFLGFDFGEATSSTAASAIWPATGRMETWQAFGDVPDLTERQRRDSAPYVAMEARGELRTYPGRVVRPDAFLSDVQADLAGCRVRAAAADSYKDSEVMDFLDRASVTVAYRLPPRRRRQGRRARRSGAATTGTSAQARDARKSFVSDGNFEIDPTAGRQWESRARQGKLPWPHRRFERRCHCLRFGRVCFRPAGTEAAEACTGGMSEEFLPYHRQMSALGSAATISRP